jgi:hypothetical protein
MKNHFVCYSAPDEYEISTDKCCATFFLLWYDAQLCEGKYLLNIEVLTFFVTETDWHGNCNESCIAPPYPVIGLQASLGELR